MRDTRCDPAASLRGPIFGAALQHQKLWSALAFVLGCLLGFDDVAALRAISGTFTATPALIPIIVASSIALIRCSSPIERKVRRLICCVILVAVIVSWLSAVTGAEAAGAVAGMDPAGKAVRSLVILAVWMMSISLGVSLYMHAPSTLRWAGIGLLSVNLGSEILQLSSILDPAASSAVHATNWFAERPRGFKFESSALGASIIAASFLASIGMTAKARLRLLVVAAVAVYLTSSRGALLALGLALVTIALASLLPRGRVPRSIFVLVTVTGGVVIFSLFAFEVVTSTPWQPLASPESDATRAAWGIAARESLSTAPLGSNLFTYWTSVRAYLSSADIQLYSAYTSLELREYRLLTFAKSDSGLTPKSLPALTAVWLGWPGLFACVAFLAATLNGVLRNLRGGTMQPLLGVSVVWCLVSFVPGIFVYELGIAAGAMIAAGFLRGGMYGASESSYRDGSGTGSIR